MLDRSQRGKIARVLVATPQPPGDRTLSYRQNTFTTNVAPGTTAIIAGSQAFFIDRDRALDFGGSFFQNFLGMGEKWLRGNNNAFGNPWYFIKPNGQFMQWDGTGAGLGSTLVGTLDPVYHSYPDLLYIATQGTLNLVLKQRLGLTFTGNFSQNFGGRNEKWLRGSNNNQHGNPWYFIDPDGRFYASDGAANRASGTLLADLDVLYYAQPERLFNAQPNEVTANVVGGVLTVQTIPNWAGRVVVETTSGAVRQIFTLNWVNNPPVLTPSGNQTRQTGQPPLNLTLTATDADTDPVTFSAVGGHLGFALQQTLGLRLQGSLSQNFGGQNEKWLLSSVNDNWYFIKPNGQLFQWDRTPRQATGTLAATLDPVYWHRPDLLYNAPNSDLAFAIDQRLGLTFTGNFFLNSGWQNEKWLLGNDGWYFVKPNGEFWKWDGTANQATGTLMATLNADFYDNMQRLFNAQPNQVVITLAGNTLTLDPAAGFIGDFWVVATVSDPSQQVHNMFKLTVIP
jgi:hypothetical protein